MDISHVFLFMLLIMSAFSLWFSYRTSKGSSNPDNDKLIKLDADISRMDPLIREEFSRNREENLRALRESREEQENALSKFERRFSDSVKDLTEMQRVKFDDLVQKQEHIRKNTDDKLGEIRLTVEAKLRTLQEDNAKQLDEMRKTVDEKLQEGLEKRFNESFNLISERLEQVHKGLGEMQHLANGVGDLKKVLSNVKTRGIFGEVQLRNLLEEFLTKSQYDENIPVKKDSQERVEFVVKVPNRDESGNDVMIPIDSKFPIEVYERLMEAYNSVGSITQKELDAAKKAFVDVVKENAKTISSKYLNPPITTDFVIMFVPTEGLYAEILNQPGLSDTLRKDYQVVVTGPTTLVAYLSTLQLAFRHLAIERRSSEVWQLLGAVKNEFGKFGNVLDATRRKLESAANEIEKAGVRSRAIERKLRDVQELPASETKGILELPAFAETDEPIEDADTDFMEEAE
ncbi:MAG: DNA recombination protein RmuC [Ignavibacteria bacterium]|jgi:DNA recombination protein RmuC